MGTRKNYKSKKSNKRFRKTRSKRQRGGVREGQRDADLMHELSNPDAPFNINVITNLLSEGVSPVAKNTALHYASKEGHVEIVEILLDNDANVNAKNNDGQTALILASIYGHKDTVDMLLKKGKADVKAKDKWGRTALVWACQNSYNNRDEDSITKRVNIVKNLLTYGSDVTQKVEPFDITLLQRAKDLDQTETITVLEQHIKFKELLSSVIEKRKKENVIIQPLSKLALENLTVDERILLTQFLDKSWDVKLNDKTGELVPYHGTRGAYRGTRGGKRKTRKSKKSKKSKRKHKK